MAKNANLPFEIGTTYFQGATASATEAASLEGKVYEIEAYNLSSGDAVKPLLTGRPKRVMIVRNSSGGALVGKRIAKMKTDGSAYEFLGQVSGYATTVGEHGYPIDEFLSTVPANDLFYVVIGGLAKVTSGPSGDTNIGIGNYVIPTTDGKAVDQDVTVAAGAATFNQAQGAIGRAVTAVNGINTDFYIEVCRS